MFSAPTLRQVCPVINAVTCAPTMASSLPIADPGGPQAKKRVLPAGLAPEPVDLYETDWRIDDLVDNLTPVNAWNRSGLPFAEKGKVFAGPVGGLGNHMFHIGTAMYYSRKYGHKLLFTTHLGHWSDTLLRRFEIEAAPNWTALPADQHQVFGNMHDSSFYKPRTNLIHFGGYCANYRLWHDVRDVIRKSLFLNSSDVKLIRKKYPGIEQGICVGVRAGPDWPADMRMVPEAYELSLAMLYKMRPHLRKQRVFLIADVPERWFKYFDANSSFAPGIFNVKESALVQFTAGLMCGNWVLSESTFHFWAAYLGEKRDTLIAVTQPSDHTEYDGVLDPLVLPFWLHVPAQRTGHYGVRPRHPPPRYDCGESGKSLESFETVAKSLVPVTDKVTHHSYQNLYDSVLPRFLDLKKKVKVLEIGLGCNHLVTPGASVPVWLKYFESVGVELHVFEFDRACGSDFALKHPNIHIHLGDQSKVADLDQVGVGYDLIIDDGGHTWNQQQVSFRHLFPKALKSRGIYVIEDLQTSYWNQAPFNDTKQSTIEYLKQFPDALLQNPPHLPEAAGVRSIVWYGEICAIEKG